MAPFIRCMYTILGKAVEEHTLFTKEGVYLPIKESLCKGVWYVLNVNSETYSYTIEKGKLLGSLEGGKDLIS